MKVLIVDEYKDYVRLMKSLGKNMVVLRSRTVTCPACGKVMLPLRCKLTSRPKLENHLKWGCQKMPWYWPWHKLVFKNKRDIIKYNYHHFTNHAVALTYFIKKYIHPYKNLKMYAKHLLEKP